MPGCEYMAMALVGVWAAVGGLLRIGVRWVRVVPGYTLSRSSVPVVRSICRKANECLGGLTVCSHEQ